MDWLDEAMTLLISLAVDEKIKLGMQAIKDLVSSSGYMNCTDWEEMNELEKIEYVISDKNVTKQIFSFHETWNDIIPSKYDNNDDLDFYLLIEEKDREQIEVECKKAFENWMYEECENSILLDEDTREDLCQIPICDYILMWLNKLEIPFEEIEVDA